MAASRRPPRAFAAVSALGFWGALFLSLHGCGVFSSAADCAEKANCAAAGPYDDASNLEPDRSGPASDGDGNATSGEAAVGDAPLEGAIGSAEGGGHDGPTPPSTDGARDGTSAPPTDGNALADAPVTEAGSGTLDG